MHSIDHPEKIGISLWDKDNLGTALNDVDRVNFNWYYNWNYRALWDSDSTPERTQYIPMIWDKTFVTGQVLAQVKASGATTLLGFNEPDDLLQANMTVEQALSLWPLLQATGLRLGSPATTKNGALGADSWLGRFMAAADKQGLRVDFIAVHYYSTDGDVNDFKEWLEAVHKQYNKPIWVTEWVLADWNNPGRFTAAEQAAFARAGSEMLDDLSFVERQSWFAAYEGGDGWHLNSSLFGANNNLTPVGRVFAELNGLIVDHGMLALKTAFTAQAYLAANPDVAAAGVNPLEHYVRNGASEGRSGSGVNPVQTVGRSITKGFDADFYLMNNPDVAAAGVNPLTHYQKMGWREGRDPDAAFDTSYYLDMNRDVAAAGVNPLEHYLQFGWKEGRDPSSRFDTSSYLVANPDVAGAGVNPLEHFLGWGIYEGRAAWDVMI